jgi:dTDP-glucose 4,6-dehydratase
MNDEIVTIHANKEKTKAGSRFYIHAKDVADALYFILINKPISSTDFGGAKIQKFNIVGYEELDNLELAQIIASKINKPLKYELVDFHSSRPGHDLRYSLSGELLKSQGWQPMSPIDIRLGEIVKWYIDNPCINFVF